MKTASLKPAPHDEPAPYFQPAALRFLKSLARNNDRDWFHERKETYETSLKQPMLALIEAINDGLAAFAPEHVRDPRKVMLRIYRDIRFSPNKQPYKTHVSAWWEPQGLSKTTGAGFYLQVSPASVMVAAGAYAPEREPLLAIRRYIAENAEELRTLLAAPDLLRDFAPFAPERLTRAPKSFPADHPALDLLLPKQWAVGCDLPAETALDPGLLPTVLARFRTAAPLVAYLNRACTAATPTRKAPSDEWS